MTDPDKRSPSTDPHDADWETLAHFFNPIEAQLALGCLRAAGLPAVLADLHLVQAHGLLASAVPVRLCLPGGHMAEGQQVLDALARGDFALPDGEPTAD